MPYGLPTLLDAQFGSGSTFLPIQHFDLTIPSQNLRVANLRLNSCAMRILALLLSLVVLFAPLTSHPAHAQADEAAWLLAQINALRQRNGLVGLTINPHLAASASAHSTYLATHPYSDPHQEANGSTPSTRAWSAGYPGKLVGENVVGGTGANVQWAFSWWMKSPIHLHNMLVEWTEIGIGIVDGPYGRWYTTDFGDQGAGLVQPTSPPPAPGAGAPPDTSPANNNATPKPDLPRPTRRPATRAPTSTPTITYTPSITYTPQPTFTPSATPTGLPPTFTPIVMEISPPPSSGQTSGKVAVAMAVTELPPAPSSSPVAVAMADPKLPPSQNAAPPSTDPIRSLIPWLLGLQGLVVGGLVVGSVIRRRARS